MSSLYEIVELANGDIALRRSDDESEPLLVIRFSDESIEALKDGRFHVAKAMIEAGMEAASDMDGEDFDGVDSGSSSDKSDDELSLTDRVIH